MNHPEFERCHSWADNPDMAGIRDKRAAAAGNMAAVGNPDTDSPGRPADIPDKWAEVV